MHIRTCYWVMLYLYLELEVTQTEMVVKKEVGNRIGSQ